MCVRVVEALDILSLFDVLNQLTVEAVAVTLALHERLNQEPETPGGQQRNRATHNMA